jgi:hypothetical protein
VSASPSCVQACAKLAGAACPNDPADSTSCLRSCQHNIDSIPSQCGGALQSLLDCENGIGTAQCGSNGQSSFTGCDNTNQTYVQCIQANTGGGGSSGSGGGGGGTADDSLCGAVCQKLLGAKCPSSNATQASCTSSCDQQTSLIPSECDQAWAAFLTCAADTGQAACASDGSADITGCDNEQNAVKDCVNGGSSTTGGACGGIVTDPTCASCFNTNCCSSGTACAADQSCTSTIDCLQNCQDNSCADNCVSQYNSQSFQAMVQCMSDQCPTECQ